ncbi:MAG: hypothetical protein OXI96_05380 [Acidimicrobiaceae bacterium]|nr:hypothetical protein [Acidimicrobiaceae bacterium]
MIESIFEAVFPAGGLITVMPARNGNTQQHQRIQRQISEGLVKALD